MLKKTLVTAQQRRRGGDLESEGQGRATGDRGRGAALAAPTRRPARSSRKRKKRPIARRSRSRGRRKSVAGELDSAIGRLSAYQSELQQKLRAFLDEQKKSLDALTETEPPSASSGNGRPRSPAPVAKNAGEKAGGSARIVHVDSAEGEPDELEAGVGHGHKRGGVRGLFFKDES